MTVFRHKETGEIVLPTPNSEYEKQLRDSKTYTEITSQEALKRVGVEAFKALPDHVKNAVEADAPVDENPPSTPGKAGGARA